MPGGFAHDYRADIQQLKSTLQQYEYDDGLPIIKEIMQNADDAGAETLHFGWTDGLAEAEHPLLRGPGVFFINDRNLSSTDAEAVLAFNLSAKADKSFSIGRFGLGLKSVFHLGEMFFYLSPPGLVFDNADAPATGYLNPWHSEHRGPHPDWSAFNSRDQRTVGEHLGGLLNGREWFCLYVPLRQRHVPHPIVARHFELGDAPPLNITTRGLPGEVGLMLPMLRSLAAVSAWDFRGDPSRPTRLFHVRLGPGAQRCRLGRDADEQGRSGFHGTIELSDERGDSRFRYSGVEHQAWSDRARQLRGSSLWPTAEVYDSEVAQPVSCSPHAAVYLVLLEHEAQPVLGVQRAVFLPLARPEPRSLPKGAPSVRLVCHGYYFVDPRRRSIEGIDAPADVVAPQTEDQVRRAWNQHIEEELLHPLLLPSLDSFVRDAQLDDGQTAALTAGLGASEVFAKHGDSICRHYLWAKVLTPRGPQWQLLDAGSLLTELPRPPDGLSLPELFPTLFSLGERVLFVLRGDPHLAKGNSLSRLVPEHLSVLLDDLDETVEATPDRVSYVSQIVSSCAGADSSNEVRARLLPVIRQWVAAAVAADREPALREPLRRLAACLPKEQLLALQFSGLDRTWAAGLAALTTDVLVLPKALEPERDDGAMNLAGVDAERLLRYIAARTVEHSAHERRALAGLITAILNACTDPAEALARCADAPLLSATLLRGGGQRERWLTLGHLREVQEDGRLFPPGTDALAQAVARAVEGVEILLLPRQLARLLNCDEEAVASWEHASEILHRHPLLAPAQARRDLLGPLLIGLRSEPAGRLRSTVRYLLHGLRAAETPSPLPLLCRSADAGVWSTIADRIVEEGKAAWAEPVLCDEVPPGLWEALGLFAADKRNGARLIDLIGPETICGEYLSVSEVRQLLLDVADPSLLRAMRIYRDLGGNWVPILSGTYWQGGFSPQAGLPPGITLLAEDDDPVARARQKRLATTLGPEAAIKEALGQPEPGRHWRLIAEALIQLEGSDSQLRQALRNVTWLPTTDGRFVAPSAVLTHSRLDEGELDQATALGMEYVAEHHLDTELRADPLRGKLRRLFMPEADCLRVVAQLLARDCSHRLGPLPLDEIADNSGLPDALCEAFRDGPAGLEVVCHVLALMGETRPRDVLAPLCQTVSADRLMRLFRVVQTRCQERSTTGTPDQLLWPLLVTYLRLVLVSGLRRELRPVQLPNRVGEWRSAADLCVGGEGVAQEHRVHKDLASLFSAGAGTPLAVLQTQSETTSPSSADLLRSYFRGWDSHVERPVIGALVGILGDDEPITMLARSYLEHRSLEWLRSRLRIGLEGHTIEAVMARQRVSVRIQETDEIALESLAGTTFKATWRGHQEHLFVASGSGGLFAVRNEGGKRVSTVVLQRIPAGSLNPTTARRLLTRSFELLLEGLYREYRVSADPELWNSLDRSTQLSIRVVQQRIIDALPLNRGQLGLRRDTELGKLLGELDAVDRQFLEVQDQARAAGGAVDARLAERVRQLKSRRKDLEGRLRQGLDASPAIQQELLAAVRQKVRNYQYGADSIPFELFQNADDALVELERLHGPEDDSANNRLVLQVRESSLRFIHCGRKINQFAYGGGEGCREAGFDADLEKMLTLSGSDKNQATDDVRVTGRFGLGFKSVFQAADAPRLLSGTLAVEIVGGIWPRLLSEKRRERLQDCLRALGPDWANGTVIDLPIAALQPDHILARFRRLLPVQLAFSRRIESCHIRGPQPFTVRWKPASVAGIDGASISPLGCGEGMAPRGLLLSPSGTEGSVLFGIGPRGFVALGDDVPAVWCTTPMRELVGLGVALNGEFQVDIGRAQVADTSDNARVASAIADGLGRMLCELYEATTRPGEWTQRKEELGLAQDVAPAEFWRTLWTVATAPFADEVATTEQVGARLLRAALWGQREGSPSGVGLLYYETPTVPSGIPGKYAGLVRLRDLTWFMSKSMMDEGVLPVLSEWELVRDSVREGTAISEAQCGRLVVLLPQVTDGVRSLSLARVLEWELQKARFEAQPPLAARLGAVYTRRRLETLPPEERAKVRELLDRVTFRTVTDTLATADTLVIGVDDDGADERDAVDRLDEQARAGFAPPTFVLAPDYTGDALRFFLACRTLLRADAATLAKWIAQAQGERRSAALQYLVTGQLSRELATQLVQSGVPGKWFDPRDPALSPVLSRMGDEATVILQGLLRRLPPSIQQPPPARLRQLSVAVRDIADWWECERSIWRAKYLKETWGDEVPCLSLSDSIRDHATRREWMRLFLMGMFHSLGRARAVQHHGFLARLCSRGWLDTIADREPATGEWERLLDDYIDSSDEDTTFYHWMRQFVGMRWLSRHLDDYVDGVRAVNLHHAPTPALIVSQRSASALQGTGDFSAPPLSRVLGIGQYFVFRELARMGLITNLTFHRHCFLPNAAVRQLAAELGCQEISLENWRDASQHLHAFLVDELGSGQAAIFGGDFDIPLQCLCRWPELRAEVGLGGSYEVADQDGWEN